MGVLKDLEPAEVFARFEEIAAIPHGSRNTKKISDYLKDFAKEKGLKCIQDVSDNIIIFKDAYPGYEDSEPVILQAHMDMVCEKTDGTDIDFEKDGLKLVVSDGTLSAEGTTLGGDDGIGVAYILAILSADDIKHPPIEAVITSDEEIGMLGAAALDVSPLSAKRMINIDSEEEGIFTCGCAGGITADCRLPVKKCDVNGTLLEIELKDFTGGHSGEEINKGRANPNQIMGRLLYSAGDGINILSVEGGLKDNAIPRSCKARIVTDEKNKEELANRIEGLFSQIRKEYEITDPSIRCEIKKGGSYNGKAFDKSSTKDCVRLLYTLPGGVIRMSPVIKGLVQTSLNMGILKTSEDEVIFGYSIRSSVTSEKTDLCRRLDCIFGSAGGYIDYSGDYPAWEYREDSPLRDIMTESYASVTGREACVNVIHAGLECGIFAGKIPDIDCVSIGPDLKDIHTPQERLDISSAQRMWRLLLEVLKRLK
ncbi:MAG: aminoacyl-histidine dipeptidase [Lachnospiraceae bacterium]|nr:aminoacyl-histidine dipeptidase [Lachnospiraceae bacterium]